MNSTPGWPLILLTAVVTLVLFIVLGGGFLWYQQYQRQLAVVRLYQEAIERKEAVERKALEAKKAAREAEIKARAVEVKPTAAQNDAP